MSHNRSHAIAYIICNDILVYISEKQKADHCQKSNCFLIGKDTKPQLHKISEMGPECTKWEVCSNCLFMSRLVCVKAFNKTCGLTAASMVENKAWYVLNEFVSIFRKQD